MKCERCESDKEAEFRVISDVLDIKVCADCAREARKIGLSLEIIEVDKAKNERALGKAEARGYPAVMVSDYGTDAVETLIQRDQDSKTKRSTGVPH